MELKLIGTCRKGLNRLRISSVDNITEHFSPVIIGSWPLFWGNCSVQRINRYWENGHPCDTSPEGVDQFLKISCSSQHSRCLYRLW